MATRLDVQLDKSGVDQGLKQTAGEIRDVGKASNEVTQAADKAGDELRQLGASGSEGASEASESVRKLREELDDVSTGADNASSGVSGLASSLAPVAIGAAAAVGAVRLLYEAAQSVREVIRELGENGSVEMAQLTSEIDNLEGVVKGVALSTVDSLVKKFQEATAAATGTSGSIIDIVDLLIPGNVRGGYEIAESLMQARDAAKEAKDEIQSLKEQASSALDAFNNRELSDQIRMESERVKSLEAVNVLLEKQKTLLKEASENGSLSEKEIKEAEQRLRSLYERRRQLERDAQKEAEDEAKRARKESEDALDEERRNDERNHRERLKQIETERREKIRTAEQAAREEERLRREKERKTQQDAKELLDADPALNDTLSGANQSKEDIARQVGRNRADRAVEGFLEDADMSRYRSVEERDRKIRQIRDSAERQGFRDTMSGMASEDEIMAARQENARATVSTVAKNAGLSENTVSALAEATRQIQNTESDLARQEAELERIRAALNSNGNAAQRRRSQRNSFRQ